MDQYKTAENKLFCANTRDFIFLAENSAIFEVTDGVKEMLARASLFKAFTCGDILSAIDGLHGEETSLFEELLSRRVFVPASEKHPGEFKSIAPEQVALNTMVLQVTDACNLGCDYCYHRSTAVGGKTPEKMSPAIGRRAVDFLVKHSRDQRELTLVFFGGEPLLNFSAILDIVAYATAQTRDQDKKIRFALTTNATMLTDDMIDAFKENEFSITVSIDGFRDIHDRHRRFANGAPSYDVIFPKIEKLVHKMGPIPVAARVTTTRNPGDIPGILKHLLDVGFAEAGFAPVTTQDFRFMLDEKDMDTLLDEFKTLSEDFLQKAQKGDLLGFTNLIDLLVALHEGDVKQYPCGAGQGLFCADAAGRLYLCQRFAGDPKAGMGDILNGIKTESLGMFLRRVKADRQGLCGECWVQNICAGGCYQEAMVRQGNPTAPNRHYCRWIKNWVELGLNVYGRLVSEQPEYLDRLSAMRGRIN